jgi:hypothetical protein
MSDQRHAMRADQNLGKADAKAATDTNLYCCQAPSPRSEGAVTRTGTYLPNRVLAFDSGRCRDRLDRHAAGVRLPGDDSDTAHWQVRLEEPIRLAFLEVERIEWFDLAKAQRKITPGRRRLDLGNVLS